MTDDVEQWRIGEKSWRRLREHAFGAEAGDPLSALDDIGLLRRVLDRVELTAVRQARATSSSWAEIAVRVGMTRQAAWERWRELDGEQKPTPVPEAAVGMSDTPVFRLRSRPTRRGLVTVPRVVGSRADEAGMKLHATGLSAVNADSGTDVLYRDDRVVAQYPDSGAPVLLGTVVRLWVERDGGGAGVREPRRPRPKSLTDHAPLQEDSEL